MNLQEDILDPSRLRLEGDFDAQVSYLLDNVRLNRIEVEGLNELYQDLENILGSIWPGCEVHPFGSIVTGLGIRTSDVDCYVYVPGQVPNKSQGVHMIKKTKNTLIRHHTLFSEVFAIPKAKVPIVKFFHIPTGRHCDVNFKSPAGVENSKLIAYYLLYFDNRVLPLAVLIKYWSKIHHLTGTNLMPNYALTMLVIFYLQQVNILPPVLTLQTSSHEDYFIDNWNSAFGEISNYETNNRQSLYELLGGFFEFYSNFDFDRLIVSPFIGCSIEKNMFKKIEHVPYEFELYKENLSKRLCQPLKTDANMCIQDPFEHSRNCAVAVYPSLARNLQFHFQNAAQIFATSTSNNFLRNILTHTTIIAAKPNKIHRRMPHPGKVIKQKVNATRFIWPRKQNIHALFGAYSRLKNRTIEFPDFA